MQSKPRDNKGAGLQGVAQKERYLKQNLENEKQNQNVQMARENDQCGKESDRKVKKENQASNKSPKCEQLKQEINEIAKKIRQANENKMVLLNIIPTARNTPLGERHTNTVVESENQTLSCDWTSTQGQFGWEEIDKASIPYLIRFGERFVSLRMAENKLFLKYKNMFTDEVHNCFSVKVSHATTAEAQLLNEINFRHCDNLYGRLEFTVSDGIVSLKDITEMYEFLNFCYLTLIEKVAVPQKRCGFIRIAGQNYVPYVWHENKQVVPLFYFEGGQCKYLEDRSLSLTGWDLAYMKLYCKIQGIRKSLFDGESVCVVELELVKTLFPADTPFEETWPAESNTDSLILRPVPKLVFSQTRDKSKQATNFNNVQSNHQPQDASKKKVISVEQNLSVPQNKQLPNTSHSTHPTQSVGGSGKNIQNNYGLVQSCPNRISNSISSSTNNTQNPRTYQNQNTLNVGNNRPIVLNNTMPITTEHANSSNVSGYQKNFVRHTLGENKFMGYKHPVVGPATVPGMYQPGSRVLQIRDVFCKNAYFVVRTQVEGKFFQYCINMEPFITTILLLTLEEISMFFQLPLESVVNAVTVMNIDIFLPNKMQRKEIQKFNLHTTRGLLKLRDFVDHLPQLRYILASKV